MSDYTSVCGLFCKLLSFDTISVMNISQLKAYEFQKENYEVLDVQNKIHRNKLVQLHKDLQIKVPLDWFFIIHSGKSIRSKILSRIKV